MKKRDNQYDIKAIISAAKRAATSYDNAAILSEEIAQRILEQLDFVTLVPERIVDVGAGTGFALPLLARRFPKAKITALDLSAAMLAQVKKKQLFSEKITGVCANALSLPFKTKSVDMIFSNLVLPWLDNPSAVFKEWFRILKPEGLLLFTSLGPDTLFELRQAFSRIDQHPRVHSFLDMHDVGDLLLKAHFLDPVVNIEYITLTYRELFGLFSDLKSQGAQNALNRRFKGLTAPSTFVKLQKIYEAHRQEDGLLPATFEVIYGHAWGRELNSYLTEQGHVAVPIQSIKRSSSS